MSDVTVIKENKGLNNTRDINEYIIGILYFCIEPQQLDPVKYPLYICLYITQTVYAVDTKKINVTNISFAVFLFDLLDSISFFI